MNVTLSVSTNCTIEGANATNDTNCSSMINATPQEWYAYRHGIERVPVARLIARDRNCWGGTAKWLGPQLSADVCMELILSLSECSDIGGYFGYAYGGDRNCACYDPTRDCSHPNAVQYMPNIGVYLIELPEIVLPTKLVTIGATEGFNETSQQELVVRCRATVL